MTNGAYTFYAARMANIATLISLNLDPLRFSFASFLLLHLFTYLHFSFHRKFRKVTQLLLYAEKFGARGKIWVLWKRYPKKVNNFWLGLVIYWEFLIEDPYKCWARCKHSLTSSLVGPDYMTNLYNINLEQHSVIALIRYSKTGSSGKGFFGNV